MACLCEKFGALYNIITMDDIDIDDYSTVC